MALPERKTKAVLECEDKQSMALPERKTKAVLECEDKQSHSVALRLAAYMPHSPERKTKAMLECEDKAKPLRCTPSCGIYASFARAQDESCA